MRSGWLILPALAGLAGCGDDPAAVTCPDILRPSLRVEVVDSATGARRTNNARGWWISGDRAGTLDRDAFQAAALLAYGPSGSYSLIIQANGYQSWGRDDLRVEGDECGPRTLEVRAALTPLPAPAE